ncbi:MAG: hypothetical protein E6R03_02870 [Hyphomicrobiaceae bacterium]|nr:MAG: hypothetical protein E6R03_02870 [Hyphomicrobiaceae bacterium]
MKYSCPYCNSPVKAQEIDSRVWRIGLGPTANVSHFISCPECGTSGLIMIRGEMFPKDPPRDKSAELDHARQLLTNAMKELALKYVREYDNPNEIRGYN